jgi:hypothetical protein
MPSGGKRNRSGPPKKPLELKVLEGSFRKDRDAETPAVVGTFPQPPADLDEYERKAWDSLPKPAWIGETDSEAVRLTVSLRADLYRLDAAMQATPDAANPITFKHTPSADGEPNMEPKINPLYTARLQHRARLMAFLSELGLTPAARGRMQAPKVDETAEDKWAGIL